MIIEIDSVICKATPSSATLSEGTDVAVTPYGRGQHVSFIRLPVGITIEQFEQACDEQMSDGCCSTPYKASEFYASVVDSFKNRGTMRLYCYDAGEDSFSEQEGDHAPRYETVWAALAKANQDDGMSPCGPKGPMRTEGDLIIFPCVYDGAHDEHNSFYYVFSPRPITYEDIKSFCPSELEDEEEDEDEEYYTVAVCFADRTHYYVISNTRILEILAEPDLDIRDTMIVDSGTPVKVNTDPTGLTDLTDLTIVFDDQPTEQRWADFTRRWGDLNGD